MSSNQDRNSDTSGASNNDSNSSEAPNSTTQNDSSWSIVVAHINENKIDFVLFVTRLLTVICTISYMIGYPEPASNRFKQALLMTGATSSLRLHQRVPPPPLNQLNMQYFTNLLKEDAFHYLLFPLLFIFGQPIALILLPCSLYAIFNLIRYIIQVLEKVGNQERIKQQISNLMTMHQRSLLQLIALSEVSLMVVVVLGVFTKVVGAMAPILYYRFLVLRYNSSRNVHLKLLVSQIRDLFYSYTNRPSQ